MDTYTLLKNKIQTRQAKIGIIGLGYVGLPLAIAFSKQGYFVYGIDTNPKHIERLDKGEQYIVDIEPQEAVSLIRRKKFFPTVKADVLSDCDCIIICVPTPLRKVKMPDISYVLTAAKTIKKHLKNQLIILESTSYPATTREVVLPVLRETGLMPEKDFFLCFSPERVNPADKKFPLTKIPKVVGGFSKESTGLAKLLYSKIIKKVFPVSSPEVAECAKLLENTFRLVNIALANEFALVCNKLGISVWEVIEAAKTKPFGFMPFYPGPGLGGHCLNGKEFIVSDNGKGSELKTIETAIEDVKKDPLSLSKRINGVEYIKPAPNYKMLTFDLEKKKAIFKPIEIFSKRKPQNDLLKVTTTGNRIISITDAHPMLVLDSNNLKIKFARDLEAGDKIPFILGMKQKDSFAEVERKNTKIDLLYFLKNHSPLIGKTRVRLRTGLWQAFKENIYKINFDNENYHDYIRYNSLPLKYFFRGEESGLMRIKHSDLLLCSGRGPSYSEMPAAIDVTPDFCRLIGYYLSKGCVTEDKSLRTRFCFNSEEKEYINDVCSILQNIGIKYSIYHSKGWKSSYVKISSNIFGFLLKDILKCGVNCYEMNMPLQLFNLGKIYKWELLKGLFRGDGGVDITTGKASYAKNGKQYYHYRNSAGINYFSSSKILFQQVIFLLQEFGIVPTFKKREGLLYILGYRQAEKFREVFLGSKQAKLNIYFSNNRKIIPNRQFEIHDGFAASAVKSIERVKGDYVYSAEVEDTHTIVSSYGAIVHNCIPIDPLYLSWKAKKLGFKTKMIDLASYINRFMPKYVVERLEKILSSNNITLNGAKILILGVAYKKDVKDLRESPALEIIEALEAQGAAVSFYDPFLPYLKLHEINLNRVELTRKILKTCDCVLVITDHSDVDYKFIKNNAKLIFDTRNIYKQGGKNIIGL